MISAGYRRVLTYRSNQLLPKQICVRIILGNDSTLDDCETTPSTSDIVASTPQLTSMATPKPTISPVVVFTPTTPRTLMPSITPGIAMPDHTLTVTPRSTMPLVLADDGLVTLIEPLSVVLNGRHIFRWSTNVTLAENQYFELVFWPAESDPLFGGFSPVGASEKTEVTVDFDKTADMLPNLFQPGKDYQWGVLLVELKPYRRLQYLGGSHRFRFSQRTSIPGEPTP